jgi:hypothetical protein
MVMPESEVFNRKRSAFWMCVNENDDGSLNFSVSQQVVDVVAYHFPELEQESPTGWRQGRNNTQNIWVPANRAAQINVSTIKQWAKFAGNQCVWLTVGNKYFLGSEVDYCIAGDFNFIANESSSVWPRSVLGEAEYQLKYRLGALTQEEKHQYCSVMSKGVLDSFDLLPLRSLGTSAGPVVSPIPAYELNKLAWGYAKHAAECKGVDFIEPRLLSPKPQMKQLTQEEKLFVWTKIYQTADSIALNNAHVKGREVVIVDDLYQSGITLWAYAKYLKGAGARNVYGLVCVRSMKDSDNQ